MVPARRGTRSHRLGTVGSVRLLFASPAATGAVGEPSDVDPGELYAAAERPTPAGRPWVVVNMVTSIDGATAVDGVSGPLGGPADARVFSAVRAVADVILAGRRTVAAERYRPPRTPERLQAMREGRGQAPRPRVAILSASLHLDPTDALFADAAEPPIVLTVAGADPDRGVALAAVAEVVEVGTGRVDLVSALAALAERGARVVLSEGGPALNSQLVEADVVDEVCLTLSPALAGGSSPRLAAGVGAGSLDRCRLASVLEEDGFLFLRYLRVR